MSDQTALERLINANHPCITIVTQEEQYALQLLHAAVMGSPRPLWIWTVLKGLYPGVLENAPSLPDTENPAAALYHLAYQVSKPSICAMLDLAGFLQDDRTLRALRDTIFKFREMGSTLILIDHDDKLPPVIAAEAMRLDLSLPNADELEGIIRATLLRQNRQQEVRARLSKRDLQTIIRNLGGLTRGQVEQIIVDAVADDQCFDASDINRVLVDKRRRLQQDGVLECVEAPVDLDEVGGLANLKQWLKLRQDAITDEAAAFGITPPRGVLLLGVQGAGKSLSAKAFATAWQRPLLRLDPGKLYDRFIGESERRLRDALRQAEMMAPIVLWIDEIEKGFASAASHSVDGGLSQRMFATLLTWMQEHKSQVFLVATANDIEALPPELLRKGRFDEIFFVDLPDKPVRRQIFAIHLAKRHREPEKFDLAALADASEGYSGAEIEQAIIASLLDAFSQKAEVDTKRVLTALRTSPPLSMTMAERIADLRDWSKGRCVPTG